MLLRDRKCGFNKVGIKTGMGKNRVFVFCLYPDEKKCSINKFYLEKRNPGGVEFPGDWTARAPSLATHHGGVACPCLLALLGEKAGQRSTQNSLETPQDFPFLKTHCQPGVATRKHGRVEPLRPHPQTDSSLFWI